MKLRDVERRLKAEGWFALLGGRANHKHFRHPTRPGKVTVPCHPEGAPGDINPITLKNIEKHSGAKMS